jgi:hypothetical protein
LGRKISKVALGEEENVFTYGSTNEPRHGIRNSAPCGINLRQSLSASGANPSISWVMASAGQAKHSRIFPLVDSALLMGAR